MRFQGGREGKPNLTQFSIILITKSSIYIFLVEGFLKGFDKLDNLVLDDCIEFLRGS